MHIYASEKHQQSTSPPLCILFLWLLSFQNCKCSVCCFVEWRKVSWQHARHASKHLRSFSSWFSSELQNRFILFTSFDSIWNSSAERVLKQYRDISVSSMCQFIRSESSDLTTPKIAKMSSKMIMWYVILMAVSFFLNKSIIMAKIAGRTKKHKIVDFLKAVSNFIVN